MKYFHINNIKFNYDLEFKNKLNKKKMSFINKHIIPIYFNFILKKKNSKIKTANITVNDIKLFFALFGIILNGLLELNTLCSCVDVVNNCPSPSANATQPWLPHPDECPLAPGNDREPRDIP